LSYRDVKDLLAERGLMVSNESIRRWVLKFGPIIAKNLRAWRGDACGDWPELRGWTILVVSQTEFQQWVEAVLHSLAGKRSFAQGARMTPVREMQKFKAAPKPSLSVITDRR
jgi:hypothetical protein